MPILDPDPCPLSSSSSEPNVSGTFDSPLKPLSLCWWIGGPFKARKTGSKKYDLTEKSLCEFNRINEDVCSKSMGPYHEGLTDSLLYLNRKKLAGCNPERESHGMAITCKIQEWSSCFQARGSSSANVSAMVKQEVTSITDKKKTDVSLMKAYCSSTDQKPLVERVSVVASIADEKKKVDASLTTVLDKSSSTKKPLIERVSAASGQSNVLVAKEENPKEREFHWANKYQPKALKEFICHREKAEMLYGLVRSGQFTHYIFEGPPGVGKKTMAMALLREKFGPDEVETREEFKEFKLEGEPISSIQMNVKVSSQHMEINLSELKEYAVHVVRELVKETHTVLLNQKNLQCDRTKDQAIILYQGEKLSMDAQLCDRSLLENYRGPYKFFFCCSDISKLQHLRSLCMVITLPPPSKKEIVDVLKFIAKQEAIELPHHLAENIAHNSNYSLRQAIHSFEATWQSNYPFVEAQVIMTGWEEELAKIAKNMIKEQSPKMLYRIREKFIILQRHNLCPEFIFSTLVGELKKHLNDRFQSIITALFEEYNVNNGGCLDGENTSNGNRIPGKRIDDTIRKNIYLFLKIEEFTAKFMSIYKVLNRKNGGGQNV